MTGDGPGQVPFEAHVELLQLFLARRKEIVEQIESVLNAQRKPASYLQDRPLLSRHLEDCFFTLESLGRDQLRLRGRLEQAHRASGFMPRRVPGLHNDLVDPAEMLIRGFHLWNATRWPGRNGRVRYAQTLFNLYVLRNLELLSMRVWDAGSDAAGGRLARVQSVLDGLWEGTPDDQPVLVRDARWLIPLAQSPTTDELGAYLEVAERVSRTPAEADRLEILKAHVLMIGGHLRSQIRHYCLQDSVSLDDDSVVLRTRTSNALDFALLVQSLVPLLEAYGRAVDRGDGKNRFELAGVIFQAISPDPELFLNRLDLVCPYSMIDYLCTAPDRDGDAAYTPMGLRHLQLVGRYKAEIDRWSKPLLDDCPRFRPLDGTCSPYGVIYGTPTNLLEDMALKALQRDAEIRFSLEDVFADGDASAEKLAWVNGWRELPHVDREVQMLYRYPQPFAEAIFDRIEQALRKRAGGARDGSPVGRLVVVPEGPGRADPEGSKTPDLPVRYVQSSDPRTAAAEKTRFQDEARLLRERQEGYFVVSYRTPGGWVGIRKDFLTEILGAGRDARVTGLPPDVAGVMRLMCPELVAREHRSGQASVPPSMLKA